MIECKQVLKVYESGESRVLALDGITLRVREGEVVAICGPSGCGKSTLLHIVGGIDRADSGEVWVGGMALHLATERQLTDFRRKQIGFVFQFFNLLPTLTVVENVELPLLLSGEKPRVARQRALEVVELVGLQERVTYFPHQLSGGQMQRVAIARGIVHRPHILLADEPTGNLDSATSSEVLEVILKVAREVGATVLLVTHSKEVAARAGRRVWMRDGKIQAIDAFI
ncbi:MAG: ABC transporter ATP-binding protein [Chthoniobacterales bacterium]|nr:ABC transporter ATP-binding protein [Chthoniobacterales bacterium]MCX7712276.1 ABC transporter ATP-binding protein [Chthoniobacterales bacterium]